MPVRLNPKHRLIALFSQVHKHLYRLSRGRFLGGKGSGRFFLLTTKGRKSGRPRTVPLLYLTVGDNFAVIASYGGNPKPPAWLLNLQSDPHVTVQTGAAIQTGVSRIAREEERSHLWGLFLQAHNGYDSYQANTTRQIAIVIIEPHQA